VFFFFYKFLYKSQSLISCNRKENIIYLFRKCLLNHYSCRQKEFISNWLMCCKYLELLGPVALLLSYLSEKSNEASLKILDWCCQLCTDTTVHFGKCSKWDNNFQSIFKYAAVKFLYQIIQSPFPKELCIFVLCICGWELLHMDLYKYAWENDTLVILSTFVLPCQSAFFFLCNPYCLFLFYTSSD